jgi:hypothetical protein
MTAQQNLQTAYDNLAAQLASITASPKPDYSENGRSISWSAYRSSIIKDMEDLLIQIQHAEGPFEVRSSGIT